MSKKITISQAINQAMCEEMSQDENIYLMGQDVGKYGGCFGVSIGMYDKFGPERVIDTPISEAVVCAMGVGSAMTGKRPIIELMFADFVSLAFHSIVMQAAKMCYVADGKASVPIVFRAPQGVGVSGGIHHSNNVEAWLMNVPGLIVVSPSTPADAKGLMKAALRSNDPVVFLEHKAQYGQKGQVPAADYITPLGKADVVKEGTDVTVIASQLMRNFAEEAIKEIEKEGISVELIDPRTIRPFDKEAFCNSAKKTGRVIIVNEHPVLGGVGGEYAAAIQEECFSYLKAPVRRVGQLETSIPWGPDEEMYVVPSKETIVSAIKNIMNQ
ncbi:alpha-ketoacid dehydrogenase subunit beta [Bacillus sp. MRMR6]|uniref:alpha-ketoacid dehydrogenase subunit beta n=1 Tax=Bacillus sp. MRMR6 TaxID=1928617 RepID=UPI001115250C|nr:alpha-ketoacid dehydrogenase subunit beta [Bacillus sp. MRMR6]